MVYYTIRGDYTMGLNQIIFLLIILIVISCIIWQLFKSRQLFLAGFILNSNSYILYLFSLIVPLVGIIVGSIKISKDDNYNRNVGINCIILSIVSTIIGIIIITK